MIESQSTVHFAIWKYYRDNANLIEGAYTLVMMVVLSASTFFANIYDIWVTYKMSKYVGAKIQRRRRQFSPK